MCQQWPTSKFAPVSPTRLIKSREKMTKNVFQKSHFIVFILD